MSTTGLACDRYLIYCHLDGSCSLKHDSPGARTHHCRSLVDTVRLANDLKTCAQMHLTVYDPVGKLLFRSFC
jgi:hypothetical protein